MWLLYDFINLKNRSSNLEIDIFEFLKEKMIIKIKIKI